MKVSNKLYSTFLVLLIIIFALGYAGIIVQQSLNTNFQKYAGKVLPSAIEAIKMKAEMEQVMEYSHLYEITSKGENRWKAWNEISNIKRSLIIYTTNSKGHVPDSVLKMIKANVTLFIEYASKYLQIDKTIDSGSTEQYKNLMKIQELKVTYTLKKLIDKDVANTKKTESILKDKTKLSFYLIIIALIVSIVIFLISILNTYFSILKPIKSLTTTSEIISKGNIETKINPTLLKKTDEIGSLARSFDTMVSYLTEMNESRNDLNIEVNEELEKNSKIIESNETLLKLKEKMEHAPLQQSTMLSTFSDDILAPINGILGYVELLNQYAISPEKRQLFTVNIKDNALVLLKFIEDLSNLAKIETGKFKILNTAFSLNDFLLQIITICESELDKAGKKHVQVVPDIDSSINIVFSDRYRLKQVFVKLIENAVKYTEYGSITIGYKFNENNGTILFYVKDTGIGIPENQSHHIFEKYKYLTRTDKKNTGFGLAVCRGIIGELKGEIWMESIDGSGTTVFFNVKYLTPAIENQIKETTHYNWADKLFLVADDEEINKVLIKECLESTKVSILFADNGLDAVNIFKNNKNIDLILMDIKMPEMDGYEATKLIKNIDSRIPIIANTAYAMLYERDKCLEIGCDDYIAKPFNITDLLSVINRNLK